MSRLIEADELKKDLQDWLDSLYLNIPFMHEHEVEAETISDCIDFVDETPTVNAVPVVRCRDCIYKRKAKVNKKGFLICPASGMEITDDDFCSYGERKEDDQ